MEKDCTVSLFDMVMSLSDAMDLVSHELTGHHKRVAYIASSLAQELKLSREEEKDLIIAGALHDAGAFSLSDRLEQLDKSIPNKNMKEAELFEAGPLYNYRGYFDHTEIGYSLIKSFTPFNKIADIIRYHHTIWDEGNINGEKVSLGSHIIHLANAIDGLINRNEEVISQSEEICKKIKRESGKKYIPIAVEAFLSLAKKELFWFNVCSSDIDRILSKRIKDVQIELDYNGLLELAKLFGQIIDFRSHFTATHSSGVAATSEVIARLMGLSENKCQKLRIAGYLHDLGKLGVPLEILNKDTQLTREEFNIIKKHPFYTYRVLDRVKELNDIKMWASYHHERIDGNGYPFHVKGEELPLEARILAVADIFTALTENRPYRKGKTLDKGVRILGDMVLDGALDANVVETVKENLDIIDSARIEAQEDKIREYEEFWDNIGQ